MKMIDDLRTDYEGKPMETAADLTFRSRVRDIQAVICTQTGPWKIFIVILFHPLDITLVIRKYAGGSVQGNILSMVRTKLGFTRLGGSSAVPNTVKNPRLSLILVQGFVDEQESAVGQKTVLVDDADSSGNGEFTEPIRVTQNNYDTVIGIGGNN